MEEILEHIGRAYSQHQQAMSVSLSSGTSLGRLESLPPQL